MTSRDKLKRISDNFKTLNGIRMVKNDSRENPEKPFIFETFSHISYLDLLHLEQAMLAQINFLGESSIPNNVESRQKVTTDGLIINQLQRTPSLKRSRSTTSVEKVQAKVD
jgi:hypothetical protein